MEDSFVARRPLVLGAARPKFAHHQIVPHAVLGRLGGVAVVELYPMTLEDGNTAETSKYGVGNNLVLSELLTCRARDVWPTRYEEVIRI